MRQTAYQEYVAECGDEGATPIEREWFERLVKTHPTDDAALENWLYDVAETPGREGVAMSDGRMASLTVAVRVFDSRIAHWQRIVDSVEPWLSHVDDLEDDLTLHGNTESAGHELHRAKALLVVARNREVAARRHFDYGLH